MGKVEIGPGYEVTPHVSLLRLLGQGGMGTIWVAEHRALGAEVAVKLLELEALTESPIARARFRREASAAARMKSPHVVKMLDHGCTADDVPFLVMELLEGESLRERLVRGVRLDMAEGEQLVVQVCKALSEAHALGIVHRDLKPENLFLLGGETAGELFVKILDFGIAKNTSSTSDSVLTHAGSILGSPRYMSPEQILSAKGVDPRSDLWSFGAVVYEALTGRPAFDGETVGSIWQTITAGEYVPPGKIEAALCPLDAWFARALQRDLGERFQTAGEMRQAFVSAAASVDRRSLATAPAEPPLVPQPTPTVVLTPPEKTTELPGETSTPSLPGRTLGGASHTVGREGRSAKVALIGGAMALALAAAMVARGMGVGTRASPASEPPVSIAEQPDATETAPDPVVASAPPAQQRAVTSAPRSEPSIAKHAALHPTPAASSARAAIQARKIVSPAASQTSYDRSNPY